MTSSTAGPSRSLEGPSGGRPDRPMPPPKPPVTAVLVHRGGRVDALAAAAGLVLAAVLALLVPVLGAVRSNDASPLWFAPGALWVMTLPAVVVVALAVRRPVVALAVAAGAGLMGMARLLADLPVLTAPDALARPDLFVETTDRSLPLHPAVGGFLLLAADLLTLGVGVYAAIRMSGRLSFQRADRTMTAPDGAVTDDTAGGTGPRRNYLLTTAGFLAVLLLALAALAVPYRGGYLATRYLTVGVPLAGMLGAVLLAVVAATAVLVAGSLPRALAVGLLGGAALGACLPSLVALVAAVTAPLQLSGSVWLGLVGGLLLLLAGLLTRAGSVIVGDDGLESTSTSPAVGIAAGACGLAGAGLAAAATFLPPLGAGGLEDLLTLTDGSPVPGSTLFGAASIPLAVAAALALLPVTTRAGRAALMVMWVALIPGVAMAVWTLMDDGLAAARSADLISVGTGTWCGVGALLAAGMAAVLAAIAAGRAADADATVTDDDSVAAARAVSWPVSGVLGVLAVVACCLPVYRTDGQIQGPTILQGSTVQAWGVWAVLLATVGALAAAAVTRHRWVALALGAAAAAAQAMRLVVPASVPEAAGFALRPGLVVQAVLVVGLLAGAGVLTVAAARIRTSPVEALGPGIARTTRRVSASRSGRASSERGTPGRTATAIGRSPRSRRKRR